MKFSLLPKNEKFLDLLDELSNYQAQIAALFEEFADSFTDLERFGDRSKEIEHWADSKNHEILEKLNKTFITPIDREDIFLLAHEIDDIIDLIDNVIHNFHLYNIKEKKVAVNDFAALIMQASENLTKLVKILRGKNSVIRAKDTVIELHKIEAQGDFIFEKAIAELFQNQHDPIAVIKWKDIFENLEAILDKYQDVSDTINGVIVKSL